MTHPDLWDGIHRGAGVNVHEGEIQSVSGNHVQIEGKIPIHTNMKVLATGWKTTHALFSSRDLLDYGPPSPMPMEADSAGRWSALESEADQSVVRTLPLLARSPDGGRNEAQASYRLYRHIVPVSNSAGSRNIAYIGMLRTAGAPILYEAQVLWAATCLTGRLDMEDEIAQTNAWIRRRYGCLRVESTFCPLRLSAGKSSHRESIMAVSMFGVARVLLGSAVKTSYMGVLCSVEDVEACYHPIAR